MTLSKPLWAGLALGGAAIVAAVGLYAIPQTPAGPPADPANAPLVALGETVYADQCASCHGANLEGESPDWRQRKPDGTLPAPPHDPSGHTWHHPDAVLLGIIRDGGAAGAPAGFKSAMPAFKETLSEEEISAVLAYIKSTWPAPVQARQAARQ